MQPLRRDLCRRRLSRTATTLLVVLLELRTSDLAKAPTDTTRSQTGPQAVRLQSLHRDAPAATRSLPSEALSYSYSPFGILLDLRTWDFAKAPPDATRSLTGAQAVRLRSLHRDAPAVTRSLPSEARSSSYNPFVLFFRFSFPLSHINATETSLWSRAFCSAVAPSWCPCCEEVLAICSSLVELPPFLWLHQLFSSRPAFRHKLRGCIPFAVTFPLDL